MDKQKEQKNSVFRVFSRQLQNYHKAKNWQNTDLDQNFSDLQKQTASING